MPRIFILSLATLFLCLRVSAQVTPQPTTSTTPTTLIPGQPVEREIAGGQSHPYQITLKAGQFIRLLAVQRGSNIVIALADRDGKEIWEANFSSNFGGPESLSYEAPMDGAYRVTIRPFVDTAKIGIYELRLESKASTAAADKKRIEAERALMEGLRSARKSDFQPAIDKALQALPLWRELGDVYWEADTLALLGSAHNSLRKFDQAIDYYNQVLVLRRQIKDRAGESNALSDLGTVSFGQNKYEQAVVYQNQALEIKRELNDHAGEARVLYLGANAHFQAGHYAQVLTLLDQALAVYQSLDDRAGIGNVYNLRGSVSFNLGKLDDAVANYQKAIENYQATKEHGAEGPTLHNLGLVKDRLGRYDEAIALFEKSLVIRRELKDRLNEGRTLSAIGNTLTKEGEYEKALKVLEDGLAIALDLKDGPSEALARMNIGMLQQKLGQSEKASQELGTAVEIAESLKNPFLERQVYKNSANLAYEQGLFEKELEFQERVLAIDRESKNQAAAITDLINIGADYRHLGRYDRALETHQQALAISRETKAKLSEAYTLANLGIDHIEQRNYREAIGYQESALALFREAKLPSPEGRTLINLGECYRNLGMHQQSIEFSNQALAIVREIKDRDGEAITQGNLGSAYNAMGQYAKAAESLQQSLEIARELKSPERLREALNELARLERNQGHLTEATAYLEQTLKSLETSRSEIYNPQSRASFLAAEHESLNLYIDLLMRRRLAEPGLDALAFEVSERSRARVLLELLGETRIDIRQNVDAALVAKEKALGKKVNIWAERAEQAAKPELAARLKLELSQLESELESTQVQIRKASPQYAALTQPQPLKLKEVQAQLDADTLLLAYSLGTERSYLWAISKDSLTSYELPKEDQIKQSALQVYELLTARSASQRGESPQQRQERIKQAEAKLPAAAQSLSDTLLAPAVARLANKRLVIVADGALQYIPFAMLPNPSVVSSQLTVVKNNGPRTTDNGQPLIVNHEVVSLPSASALAIQRTELAGRPIAPKVLAVIADPVFDSNDKRFITPATELTPQTLAFEDTRSIEHLAENSKNKAGVTTLVIPRLPFTRQEATRLLALAPKNSSFGATDFQASRATVLDPALSQYRYVHFATHGYLDSERPGLSALVLSLVDAQGKPQDGFLRANDIYNLKLPAELVVLSACQTGLGKEIKGEGLVGLTRGFMYAGAARVVVSLWNVNDKATADLMTKFYQGMLKQGEPPAAALRAAQVEMWKQKQWQSPYYWAAFIMQGEWR
jgi:CHAT domain-containing protein/tetratricopeptide (TPR) repeat protein